MTELKSFRRKQEIVAAVRWTFDGPMVPENQGSWPAIQELCGHRARLEGSRIIVQTGDGPTRAEIGHWVLRTPDGSLEVLHNEDLCAQYEPAVLPAAVSAKGSGSEEKKGFEGWAILELMGHRRLAGKVSEAVIAGAPLLRIDIPLRPPAEGFSTQFYGSPAIYCLTPTSEELARAVAAKDQPEPVNIWELPELRRKQLVGATDSSSVPEDLEF